jgi:drug/metabolite transporter (DMT)-like permease
MPAAALALVLMAAVLHVGWNALAKRGRNQLCFLWSAQTAAGALFVVPALWILAADGLPVAAMPFVVATGVLHAFYFYALGRSYTAGAFSLVYPVARGLGVALVPLLALAFFDERPSWLGVLGVALVVAGIVGLQLATQGWGRLTAQLRQAGAGTVWAVLTGITIACYSLVDKGGVALLHPVPYVTLMGFGAGLLMLPAVRGAGDALSQEWRTNWRSILVASTMTLTSYLMVLFAFRLSKVSYVVAAREISIVLSAVIGSVWFKEGPLAPRLAGAALVAAGVVCVALAR